MPCKSCAWHFWGTCVTFTRRNITWEQLPVPAKHWAQSRLIRKTGQHFLMTNSIVVWSLLKLLFYFLNSSSISGSSTGILSPARGFSVCTEVL